MITKKLKKCDGECGQLAYIWKNEGGKKYCKNCYQKNRCVHEVANTKPTKKQYRIPSKSSKKAKLDTAYAVLREQYLKMKPMCQAHLPNICTSKATDIHHKYSGKDRSVYYLDMATWLSVCRDCHKWIHNFSREARELDLLK